MLRRRVRREVEWQFAQGPRRVALGLRAREVLGRRVLPYGAFYDDVRSARWHIAIDGYPRSGNSFACATARRAWPDLGIASHQHSVFARTSAALSGGWTLIPVRDPLDAVCSLMVLSRGLGLSRVGAIDSVAKLEDEFERFVFLLKSPRKAKPRTLLVGFQAITDATWIVDAATRMGPRALTPDVTTVRADLESQEMASRAWLDPVMQGSVPRAERTARLAEARRVVLRVAAPSLARARSALERVWREAHLDARAIGPYPRGERP